MLDTDALRFDVAEAVRAASRTSARTTQWYVGPTTVRLDERGETLTLDDQVIIDLERVIVRVPSTGRRARGPVLARCPRGCGERARVLWVDPLDIAEEVFPICRACAGIEYASTKGTELERARLAYERFRARLGLGRHATHEPRPYQKPSSYQRDARRLKKLKERLCAAEKASMRAALRPFRAKADPGRG